MHSIPVDQDSNELTMQFFGAVLHLRGPQTVPQPLVDKRQDVLCWNGEIFGGIEVDADENDTQMLMRELEQINEIEDDWSDSQVLDVLQRIEGPYSIVFWQASTSRLWFARDCLGRRSLLWHNPTSDLDNFYLSSVASTAASTAETDFWEEVPANGIYCIHVDKLVTSSGISALPECMTHFQWKHADEQSSSPRSRYLALPFPRVNTEVPESLTTENIPAADDFVPPVSDELDRAITEFHAVLGDSVRRRVIDIPSHRSTSDTSASETKVGILFSGGLDCLCLAALVDAHLPHDQTIDLLNVAFENPRINQKSTGSPSYGVPDRKTGRCSVEELRTIAPHRTWNFVEINVPYEEATHYRQQIIDRMNPLDTVMDLSIAMAFWFAARGKGFVKQTDGTEEPYHSTARVLLSGLGADEQLGGYSRHREAFRQGGWTQMIKEIQLDVDRIASRNMGRDDRIISDHGKEVRFPFLSTDVVRWLCLTRCDLKLDMRYPRGIGEKSLLRHLCRRLGMQEASRNWKRAIQFGAKTAKMTGETRKEKGQQKLL
ncbi:Asparagine synthetase domain-containing protein 1 [Umbelopsis nana]